MEAKTLYIAMPQNANHQPVYPSFQHGTKRAAFPAAICRFAVISGEERSAEYPGIGIGTIRHHGAWSTLDEAHRFAWSMGDARAVEVEPYVYCFAWGQVEPKDIGPARMFDLDDSAALDCR